MRVELAYGRVKLVADRQAQVLPLTGPLDDVLGLLRSPGTREGYREFLVARYGGAAVERLEQTHLQEVATAVEAAAHAGEDQRLDLPALLERHLARVSFAHANEAEIPDDDLLALAAYVLVQIILRARPFRVAACPRCLAPWLAPIHGPDHCLRPAPGGHVRSCRAVDKEEKLLNRDAYRMYRREYKRITEAVRRGSISRTDAESWRKANTQYTWMPFNDWKTLKRRPKRRKAGADG